MALNYDLILKGGEVIDPSQNLRGKRDVGFKGGKVAAVSESLPSEEGAHVIDVSGKMVTPGLIDLHTHFAYNVAPFCVNPDPTYLPLGITTAVDTGTTGWMNFPAFRSLVLERSDANLFAFIHLSSIGTMMPGSIEIPDLADFRFARADEAIRCIKDNRDLVLGVKVRLSPDGTTAEHAVPSLEMARKIADATGSLLMVHVMNSVLPLPQVMEYLKPGDIRHPHLPGHSKQHPRRQGRDTKRGSGRVRQRRHFRHCLLCRALHYAHKQKGHRRRYETPHVEHRHGG